MSQWTEILDSTELEARYARIAELDPTFAKSQRAFYEASAAETLRDFRAGSWYANDPEGYQLARSYLALRGDTATAPATP
jgi:hypothetical protein